TAGSPEPDGGDGLALGAVDARPDGSVHAVERHQAAAGVAHRHADLDVHLARLVERGLNGAIGFDEGQGHAVPSCIGSRWERPGSITCRLASRPGAQPGASTTDPNPEALRAPTRGVTPSRPCLDSPVSCKHSVIAPMRSPRSCEPSEPSGPSRPCES